MVALPATLAAALAACGSPSAEVSPELERDLAAVRSSSVDLTPRAAPRTMVVSAEEQVGTAIPARRSPVARRPKATARPRSPAPTVAAPAEEAVSAAPAASTRVAEPAEPAVSGPLHRPPEATPEPPGGYRSVGDVIRNAPFPIKP
jgi:hypothetical protein